MKPGCQNGWDVHTCSKPQGHDGDHRCECGIKTH